MGSHQSFTGMYLLSLAVLPLACNNEAVPPYLWPGSMKPYYCVRVFLWRLTNLFSPMSVKLYHPILELHLWSLVTLPFVCLFVCLCTTLFLACICWALPLYHWLLAMTIYHSILTCTCRALLLCTWSLWLESYHPKLSPRLWNLSLACIYGILPLYHWPVSVKIDHISSKGLPYALGNNVLNRNVSHDVLECECFD